MMIDEIKSELYLKIWLWVGMGKMGRIKLFKFLAILHEKVVAFLGVLWVIGPALSTCGVDVSRRSTKGED